MGSLQSKAKGLERAYLHTTIKKDALDTFKAICKENGYPLNMILEIFIEQFNNGEFTLQLDEKKVHRQKIRKEN